MGQYLVTGRAGSGKTAVATELKRRGFVAFDADDVPGLSTWVDTFSGKPVIIEDNSNVDLDRYRWVWDAATLRELLSNNPDMFLCGGADNDLSFTDLFDGSFVLDVTPPVQIERLRTRTDNDYGQGPAMHDRIVAQQREHLSSALKHTAHRIDANQPIKSVVDDILRHAHASR